ncbi:MAG: glutamate 5-kinase [Oscillospiraceae bacterium]|jgi:glutamate 5-kinase|nr:glutamate 5-kinase [Oscillospiraceae bacterium]
MRSIQEARRIVIKVGTSTLTHAGGKSNLRRMGRLAAVLADLRNAGREVVLVTSGAIGVGVGKLGLRERPKDIPGKQAAAAIGQCELMFLYDKLFGEYGNVVGQLLLTREDVDNPQRRQNLMNTFTQLFAYGAIPIVNENDSVSSEEIEAGGSTFGENDALAAIVAKLVGADALVFLTDADGLCTGNPSEDETATLLPVVPEVTEEILALAGPSGTQRGSGGMITKLQAAKAATEAGIDTVILNGTSPENLYQLLDGRQIGTWFKHRVRERDYHA